MQLSIEALIASQLQHPNRYDLLLQIADHYYSRQAWPHAIRYLERYHQLRPDDPRAGERLGTAYLHHHRYRDAERLFNQLIVGYPHDLYLRRNIANLYFSQQLYKRAARIYQQLLQRNRDDEAARFNLALCQLQLGSWQKAAGLLKKYLHANPRSDAGWFYLAVSYDAIGDTPAAEDALKTVLRLNQTHVSATLRLGLIEAKQGQFAKAIQRVSGVRTLDPDSAAVDFTLGNIYREQGDLEAALAAHLSSAEREPQNFMIEQAVAIDYAQLARYQDALTRLHSVADKSDPDLQLLQSLVLRYRLIAGLTSDDRAEILDTIQGLENLPWPHSAMLTVKRYLRLASSSAATDGETARASTSFRDDSTIDVALAGEAWVQRGDLAAAQTHFAELARRVKPTFQDAAIVRRYQARVALLLDQPGDVLSLYAEPIRKRELDGTDLLLLGLARVRLGDLRPLLSIPFDMTALTDSELQSALAMLFAMALEQNGQPGEAAALLLTNLPSGTEPTQHHEQLKRLLTIHLRHVAADRAIPTNLDMAKEALRRFPDDETLALVTGVLFYRAGQPDVAIPLFRRFPDSPTAQFNLALVYRSLQEIPHAIEAGQRYLALSPDDQEWMNQLLSLQQSIIKVRP